MSKVFHPFVVPVLVLFWAQRLSGVPPSAALGWTALTVAVLILPVLVLVLLRVRAGRYEDVGVSVREDRHLLYVLAGACFLLLIILLIIFDAPGVVRETLQAALFAFGVAAVLNRAIGKVSLHMLAMGGCAAVFAFTSAPLAVVLGLLSLPVGWSRLYLTRHTVLEVVLGWSVGFLCFTCWLLML